MKMLIVQTWTFFKSISSPFLYFYLNEKHCSTSLELKKKCAGFKAKCNVLSTTPLKNMLPSKFLPGKRDVLHSTAVAKRKVPFFSGAFKESWLKILYGWHFITFKFSYLDMTCFRSCNIIPLKTGIKYWALIWSSREVVCPF